jgi:hypothetical protein
MPLTKKIITFTVFIVLLFSFFSGCLFDDLFGGTEFSLITLSITDDEGFPSLSLYFSCTGTVTIRILNPGSKIIDSDSYFKGDHDIILHLADFRHSVTPGSYKLRAYDSNDNEIYSKTITLSGSDLSILSSEQKWWKKDNGKYSLFGLSFNVQNNGDTPSYPFKTVVDIDFETISGPVLPSVIMPGKNKDINCFIYKESETDDDTFSVNLKDIDENILASESFSVDIVDNVPVEHFEWNFRGKRQINIPKSEYLYDYYVGLNRYNVEDYSAYVFNPYDDQYIDILIELFMSGFSGTKDPDIINYAVSFVQTLEYKSDSKTNGSYEYPNYPLETIFTGDGGGDCEDKAIYTAHILKNLGYTVALLRFPDHMAVGVNLSEEDISAYEFFIDGYYFLETTTGGKLCGFVPTEYRELTSEVIIHPLSDRPLLDHSWEDGTITIFTSTEIGDFVKVVLLVENIGSITAENFVVEAGFFTESGLKSNNKRATIAKLGPGLKEKVVLSVNIPKSITTRFKTRIYLDGEIVDEKESVSNFPTN